MSNKRYVKVAVSGPMRTSFTYQSPPGFADLTPGQRLLVPFGAKRSVGFYLGPAEKSDTHETKPVIQPVEFQSHFSSEMFSLCAWMADYYFANPADCLSAALPGGFRGTHKPVYRWSETPPGLFREIRGVRVSQGKQISQAALRTLSKSSKDAMRRLIAEGWIVESWPETQQEDARRVMGYRLVDTGRVAELHSKSAKVEPFSGVRSRADLKLLGWSDYLIRKAVRLRVIEPVQAEELPALHFIKGRPDVAGIELNAEQRTVVESVSHALGGGFRTFLLHGITGSGKTIVYCHLAREVIQSGQSVLVLTPEIALSGATLAYFRGFFGGAVTVLHSGMTERERFNSWQGIRSGKYQIVVGPRSALFAPLSKLGLIIVDEEHDGSYKQDDPAPRFHGRDCAIMRGKFNNVPVLLGSASPSIESYHQAQTGRYTLLKLTQRPGSAVLPEVRVVDMRNQAVRGDLPFISLPLKKAVERRITSGEQTILFLNRRGYSTALKCGDCGHFPECPSCQIGLTYHKSGRKLVCHYCGFVRTDYDVCDTCGSRSLLYPGTGTQKVEEAVPRLFPGVSTIRLDSDSASGRQNAHRILDSFARREHQILLGTQMVTKGLDMPEVSLVGVLSADLGAELPDFRSAEKTFARLLQVAGRSGRAGKKGEVLIQTYSPESPHIVDAARQDYEAFFAREIDSRRDGEYPPFTRLVTMTLAAADAEKLEVAAQQFAVRLRDETLTAGLQASILGPAPCPMYHLKRMFRRHILVKTRQVIKFVQMLTDWERREPRFQLPSAVKLVIDVDPNDMM